MTSAANAWPALFAAMGMEDEGAEISAFLAERGTTTAEVIETTLSSLDVEATLRGGGLTDEDLAALRDADARAGLSRGAQ